MEFLGLVPAVLNAVHAQYETYNQLQDVKRESLVNLQRTVSRLTIDLRIYQKFIEALHESEHQPALSKLLSTSSGRESFKAFESALITAKDRCQKLAPQEVSCSERKGVAKRLIASAMFSDALTSSTKRVDDATADLRADTDTIEAAYKQFYALYMIHEMSSLRQSRKPSHTRPSSEFTGHQQAMDAVVSSFYRTPFCLNTQRVPVNTLLKLNENREIAEQFAEVIKKEGAIWAEGVNELDSVDNLGRIQTRLMELLWTFCVPQMESDALQIIGEERISNMEMEELSLGLKSAIVRAKTQSFSVAFCGMVKAGKSLFLNALMGRTVLPSDELPSTAWPCRLRHVPKQTVPKLTFEPEPFRCGLEKLRACKYGTQMQTYTPPTDDPFADILDNGVPNTTSNEYLGQIYYQWKDLHKQTRENLLKFEHPDFELPSCAEGGEQVTRLLGQLNDIVRLCHRFNLGFTLDSREWPLLCVEFESLRKRNVEGIFEFIDLPGLGEDFDGFDFEEMITRVAEEANAVVPIVSFKEIAKQDWRRLPRIISSGLQTRASMVICTHFDQISKNNLAEQLANVAKIFWPELPRATDRVIPCSSNMGLSAATLLCRSVNVLPAFEDVWREDSIGYLCAKTILGVGNPRATYRTFDLTLWRSAVEKQWHKSGLPDALRRLTSDLVAQAKQRVFISEGAQLCKQVRKINIGQQRVLLEMRRSRDELEAARVEFQRARAEFTTTLQVWGVEERRRDTEYDAKLRQSIERLREIGNQSVQKALQELTSSNPEMFPRDTLSPGVDPLPNLLVGSRQQAEDFLRASQTRLTALLLELKHRFVSTIRELANRANRDRVESLRQAIRVFRNDMETELRSEILVDLESLTVNVRALAFNSIQKGLKTERVRYSPGEMYKIFEGAVAKPFLSLQEDVIDHITPEVTIKDLGLLVRAPVAVIATVPFVLSAGVWLVMTKTKKYHCDLPGLAKLYQEKIVAPFLQDLQIESSKSLKSALAQSSAVAKATVEYALQREDLRYERESKEKDNMPPREQVAELVASHANFLAAEGAFLSLKSYLQKFIV